jgi:hypothetical protein
MKYRRKCQKLYFCFLGQAKKVHVHKDSGANHRFVCCKGIYVALLAPFLKPPQKNYVLESVVKGARERKIVTKRLAIHPKPIILYRPT